MPRDRAKLTVGEILGDAFSNFGIKTQKKPILTQWTVSEYGISERRIDTLGTFIASLANGNYHIRLEDTSIEVPKYEQFRIKSMDLEATLLNEKWVDINIYSDEEEVPSMKCATPKDLQNRKGDVEEIVRKVLTFLLLIWKAIKTIEGFSSS